MASKDELIASLKELGEKLGRELDTTGTPAELQLRVREAREEFEALSEESDDTEQPKPADKPDVATDTSAKDKAKAETKNALVKLRVLSTVHINALHETRNEVINIAYSGDVVRVSADVADDLLDSGYTENL
ncbi:Uncharacterised protein [Serratia rubidaea]|uniref:DNA-packaging protein FI n=1 Tax=Serratia rubidaea TaxID=61652 RepID=A0A3S4JMG5_SERRU|nr:Uncharacterised protein [Serratia rubidaea]